MQAIKSNYDRDVQQREEQAEEKRKSILKQVASMLY